jgi:hypothetical protein
MSDLSNGTQKHTSKSQETIPLNYPDKVYLVNFEANTKLNALKQLYNLNAYYTKLVPNKVIFVMKQF